MVTASRGLTTASVKPTTPPAGSPSPTVRRVKVRSGDVPSTDQTTDNSGIGVVGFVSTSVRGSSRQVS